MTTPEVFTVHLRLSNCPVKCAIPGEPHSWERVTFSDGKPRDTEDNKIWKRTVRQYIQLSNPQLIAKGPDEESKFGAILLFATNNTRTDWDNLAKVIMDACNKFVWKDDRQVEEAFVKVVRGNCVEARTQIFLYRIGGEDFTTGRLF